MSDASEMDQHDTEYVLEENKEFVRQINELRRLLAMCWDLVPDGPFRADLAESAVEVKRGMDRYMCWPRDFDA